jgi:hypothetical protein
MSVTRWLMVLLLVGSGGAGVPASDPDPPPLDEAAIAAQLFEMVSASAGERAILVHDPSYYPGITSRLREALHQAGVQTYLVVEDTMPVWSSISAPTGRMAGATARWACGG